MQEGNLRAPLQDTEMRLHHVLTGSGTPDKSELLLEGRSRRASHMLPFPALRCMIYQVVMEKKKPTQDKTSKERNNWIEAVQPGLLFVLQPAQGNVILGEAGGWIQASSSGALTGDERKGSG